MYTVTSVVDMATKLVEQENYYRNYSCQSNINTGLLLGVQVRTTRSPGYDIDLSDSTDGDKWLTLGSFSAGDLIDVYIILAGLENMKISEDTGPNATRFDIEGTQSL